MDNNEILNPYEGKKIGEFVWPFYRYDALIPEQLGGDVFVWLYLSIIVFINETKNLARDNYGEDIKIEAQKLITNKFSNIIDTQTLDKIVHNAERDFIEKNTINQDTFSFLSTYENLFSEKCDTKRVYQDAVTGEIVPFFGDTSFIDDAPIIDKNKYFNKMNVKDPSGKAVKKAYDSYMKLKKFNVVKRVEEAEIELEDEFFDADEQTFLDSKNEEINFVQEKNEQRSLRNSDVHFLNDSRVEFRLAVPVFIKDNSISIQSPFGKLTDGWINKCLKKGRNISPDMDIKVKALESLYLIEETKIQAYIESHRKDFASSLKYCQTLYRLIDSLNDDKMRKNVVELDARFSEGDSICYLYAGKILDGMVSHIQYFGKTTAEERDSTDFSQFCIELDNKLKFTSVQYEFLKSKNIFDDWKKKYCRRDGKEYMSFKADLTDIILRTNIINSPNIYDTFIDDIFKVYSYRNAVAHDDDDVTVNHEKLDILTKAVKLLFELV